MAAPRETFRPVIPGAAPSTAADATASPPAPSSAPLPNRHPTPAAHSGRWRGRCVAGLLALCVILTLGGVVWLWPGSSPVAMNEEVRDRSDMSLTTVPATVESLTHGACGSPSLGRAFPHSPEEPPVATHRCERTTFRITGGPDAGQYTVLEFSGLPGDPTVAVGDTVRLGYRTDTAGQVRYTFQDYERGTAMVWWVLAAAVSFIIVGGVRGVRSLLGIALTVVIVLGFMVPALLHGHPPVAVAVIGGSAIVCAVLFLVHGWSYKTASALVGTLVALAAAVVLSEIALLTTRVTGLSEDSNHFIVLILPGVSVTGLLLAGFIIGALGVLNDVTISQAATVYELAELDTQASPPRLFRSAMRVGRDHIASMVYTLVLSYTGAALPLLLLLSVSGRPLGQILTSDILAVEILRSLVGAMALVLAVPVTTAIAAWLAGHRTADTAAGAPAQVADHRTAPS